MASVDDIKVGDQVNVPGGMYGTVKFLGTVAGKPGRFAGVELGSEHAGKGKNNGDVDGRHYFRTSVPGSGIFVPINNSKYVSKRTAGTPPTPTPSRPSGVNFSKSVGPSPSAPRPKLRRPSLPRPESPRMGPPTKLNLSGIRTPSAFSKSTPAGGNVPRTPLKTPTRPGSRVSQSTDTPTSSRTDGGRTPRRTSDDSGLLDKIRDLEKQLQDRDKQLDEQSSTLADFQKSITELEGSDALHVRAQLREKNEKIAALTAEFDSHRADFRSTLDTLEVAASETERVYEKRLDELMQANRDLQDRGEDVETVARQLKQLEELVSELEEGLEDARRGEAEARGEVEFLRGEVERTRLELKQEREKSATALKDAGAAVDSATGVRPTGAKDLDQKDDEIRGLKAIIHSLSRGEAVSSPTTPHQNGPMANGNPESSDPERISRLEHRIQELEGLADRKTYRIEELEQELDQFQPFPSNRNSRNRSGTVTASPSKHKSSNSAGTNANAPNHAHRLSDRTVVPGDWRDSQNNGNNGANAQYPGYPPPLESHRQLETMHESESRYSGTDDEGSLWCEICETGGHDILTCTNMFGNGNGNAKGGEAADAKPAETTENTNKPNHGANPGSNGSNSLRNNINSPTQRTGRDAVLEGLKGIGGLTAQMTPVAGKASGVVDESRWCALCERDGHESIDCPFED
ncbi:hypothetical protein FQN54_003316 [Arachnomyces sp. PD_36]|nr:hypothetical protein FQN54_003316 [Arachnomyces sp. PD_36]